MAQKNQPGSSPDLIDKKIEFEMAEEEIFPQDTETSVKGRKPVNIEGRSNSFYVEREGNGEGTLYEIEGRKWLKKANVPSKSVHMISPTDFHNVDRTIKGTAQWNWPHNPQRVEDIQGVLSQHYDTLVTSGILAEMLAEDPECYKSHEKFRELWDELCRAGVIVGDFAKYNDMFVNERFTLPGKKRNPFKHFAQHNFQQRTAGGGNVAPELAGINTDNLLFANHTNYSIALSEDGQKVLFLSMPDPRDMKTWQIKELNLKGIKGTQALSGVGISHDEKVAFLAQGKSLIAIDPHTDPVLELGRFEHPKPRRKFEGVIITSTAGEILVGDKQGRLNVVKSNFHLIEGSEERMKLIERLREASTIERERVEHQEQATGTINPLIAEMQENIASQFEEEIAEAETFDDLITIRKEVEVFKTDQIKPVLKEDRLIELAFRQVYEQLDQREEVIAEEVSAEIFEEFEEEIAEAETFEEIELLKEKLNKKAEEYRDKVSHTKHLKTIKFDTLKGIKEREEEISVRAIESEKQAIKRALKDISALDVPSLVNMRARAEKLAEKAKTADIEAGEKQKITALTEEFSDKALKLLKQNEAEVIKGIVRVFENFKDSLQAIKTPGDFDRWVNNEAAVFKDQLAQYMLVTPIAHTEVRKKVLEISQKTSTFIKQARKKFEEEYDQLRQVTVESTEAKVKMTEAQINDLLEIAESKIKRKEFQNGDEFENWIKNDPAYETITSLIDDIEGNSREKAQSLRRLIRTKISELRFRVEKIASIRIDEATGAQMYPFGNVLFPIWERKRILSEQAKKIKVELSFKRLNGVSSTPIDDPCELCLKVTDSDGNVTEHPLYEDAIRKYGLLVSDPSLDDKFASIMPIRRARQVIRATEQMQKTGSKLKNEFQDYRQRLKKIQEDLRILRDKWKEEFDKLPKKKRTAEALEKIKSKTNGYTELTQERDELIKKYIDFLEENGLYAWFALKNANKRYKNGRAIEDKEKNAQGEVPEWAWYWVIDPETEENLQEFAREANRQLRLKSGIISLEGHAGTGKDVLLQMFCERTKRPLFAFDCSKWTTEYDLSETIQFQEKDGATVNVKVPSILVKAIQTPGAVMYFNEFNAMPHTAQIFLHALLDAKRQITLKTSGKIIKADPTVILASSMNPEYPGTNTPQFATRDRMVVIPIEYPAFERKDAAGTVTGREPSEALRVARSVKSLEELTLEQDLSKNDFVQLWEKYINRRDEDDTRLTEERKYDMDTIYALVQFTQEIRQAFVKHITGQLQGPDDFELSQLFSGRGMRACADYLSYDVTANQKDSNMPQYIKPEKMAKQMIRRFYASYLFNAEEKQKLEHNMQTEWTIQKP